MSGDWTTSSVERAEPGQGGLFDGHLALRASCAALADAGLEAVDVDVLVHVTTTPDLIACQDHFRFLMTELGLRRDADRPSQPAGGLGLATGLRTTACSLVSMAPATALVVAT